jgi:hypothetical protein
MTRLVLLPLMAVLLPSWAGAQLSSPEPESPQPQGELIPWELPFAEPKYGAVQRVPLELLGGTLGGALGLLPGTLVLAASADSQCGGDFCGNAAGLLGGIALVAVGMPLGMAAGISGAGKVLEGEGNYAYAFGGISVGGLVGYLLAHVVLEDPEGDNADLVSLSAGALVGGVITYEVAHHLAVEKRRLRHSPRVQVVPVLTLDQEGRVLGGLAGRF